MQKILVGILRSAERECAREQSVNAASDADARMKIEARIAGLNDPLGRAFLVAPAFSRGGGLLMSSEVFCAAVLARFGMLQFHAAHVLSPSGVAYIKGPATVNSTGTCNRCGRVDCTPDHFLVCKKLAGLVTNRHNNVVHALATMVRNHTHYPVGTEMSLEHIDSDRRANSSKKRLDLVVIRGEGAQAKPQAYDVTIVTNGRASFADCAAAKAASKRKKYDRHMAAMQYPPVEALVFNPFGQAAEPVYDLLNDVFGAADTLHNSSTYDHMVSQRLAKQRAIWQISMLLARWCGIMALAVIDSGHSRSARFSLSRVIPSV